MSIFLGYLPDHFFFFFTTNLVEKDPKIGKNPEAINTPLS